MQNTLIIFGARYLIFLMIAIAAATFLFLTKEERKKNIIWTGLVFIFSFALAKTLSFFFYNPRPFVTEKITPLIAHAADNGFPSDHTLLASALASVVFSFNKKAGILLWVLAIAVGVSRILAGVHHALDVVGSIVVVLIVSYLSKIFFVRKAGK